MSFSLDISKFAEKAKGNSSAVVKKVAADMFGRVVLRTPVDTGRARGNWQITFNVPAEGTSQQVDPTGRGAISEITAKAAQWKDGAIWLTNNLPYIERLEYGWSKQAPAGMARVTVREFQSYVDSAVRGLK